MPARKQKYARKNFANKGSYRTKEHGHGSQNNNMNNSNENETETKSNGVNKINQEHSGDGSANANQWPKYQDKQQHQQAVGREENKEIENGANAIPKSFETLSLSGWYIVIESLSPQPLDKFQTQLFELSPVSLKTFRLEIPSSPVQSSWVNRVQWAQLSTFLSQANLEQAIISPLQPKAGHFNDQDFQELEPVAQFVSALKCKCLVLECAPCNITPNYVQSLSDRIEELKLLCPSIQWNVDMVRALSPKLNYLGLICPNSLTIQELLDALGDKTQRLCLYNDELSPRKLSPEDVSTLFQHVLSLELDGSLLTEIHPTPETTKTKIKALMIRLKDEVPEKAFYEKHSLPTSIIHFNVCPIDPSSITKRWNINATHEETKHINHGSNRVQNMELGYHHEPTQKTKRETIYEDNKATSNTLQQTQNHASTQPNDGKKMTFKEKLQSNQKNIKKNTLRIEGQTL